MRWNQLFFLIVASAITIIVVCLVDVQHRLDHGQTNRKNILGRKRLGEGIQSQRRLFAQGPSRGCIAGVLGILLVIIVQVVVVVMDVVVTAVVV